MSPILSVKDVPRLYHSDFQQGAEGTNPRGRGFDPHRRRSAQEYEATYYRFGNGCNADIQLMRQRTIIDL